MPASRPGILLIGAGGHARACIDVIEQSAEYRIAGLVGMPEELNTRHLGYPVIATDTDLQQLATRENYVLIAVGQIHSAERRIRLWRQVVEMGFSMPSIVAPTAHVGTHASIGDGTIVMHGAIINSGAKIGRNCIINTKAVVEHDAVVDDHCHISTGAILNGSVSVGAGSFVGSGCVVKDGVTIGKSCVIGIGLCLRKDQADNTIYTGQDKS